MAQAANATPGTDDEQQDKAATLRASMGQPAPPPASSPQAANPKVQGAVLAAMGGSPTGTTSVGKDVTGAGAGPNTGVNAANEQIAGGGVFGWGTQGFNTYSADKNAWDTSGLDKTTDQAKVLNDSIQGRATQQMTGGKVGAMAQSAGTQGQSFQTDPSIAANLEASARGGGAVGQATNAAITKSTDATISSQMALAASQQGGNPMLAYRNAMNNAAGAQQTAAGQIAAQTAQNSMNATGQQIQNSEFNAGQQQSGSQFNATLGQANNQFNAGQSNTGALTQAQLDETTGSTNLQSAVQQQQWKDDAAQKYIATGMTVEAAKEAAAEDFQKYQTTLLANQEAAKHGVAAAGQAAGASQLEGVTKAVAALASSGGTIAGAVGGGSDKRIKKNISDGEDETIKFLRALKPHGFEYKDPAQFGKGRYLGVMAQDVEKAAPEIVTNDTDGVKKLDIWKALSASLAGLGTLNERLEKVEGKRGR